MKCRLTWLLPLACLLSSVACSSDDDDDDKPAAASGITCTITVADDLASCYAFDSSFPKSQTDSVCKLNVSSSVGKVVSACPADGIIGTCKAKFETDGKTSGYDWVFYETGPYTCEQSKQACAGVDGVIEGATATWDGGC